MSGLVGLMFSSIMEMKSNFFFSPMKSMHSCYEAFQPYGGSEDEENRKEHPSIAECLFNYIEDDMDASQGPIVS